MRGGVKHYVFLGVVLCVDCEGLVTVQAVE